MLHATLGPLCYLCDYIGGASSQRHLKEAAAAEEATAFTIVPRDAYRQRVYLEPVGLYLQADSGIIASLTFDLGRRRASVIFAPPKQTPAGERTYSLLRLRVDQVSRPGLRPGSNFTVIDPPGLERVRAAFVIPGSDTASVQVTVAWEMSNHVKRRW